MQPYKCKVRLAGSPMNEVIKTGIYAAEILVLRQLHGEDAVVDIVEDGKMDKRSHEEVRRHIYMTYANPETVTKEVYAQRMAMMRNVLGPDVSALPARLPGLGPVEEDVLE